MKTLVKNRLVERAVPTTKTIQKELLAERTCPLCAFTIATSKALVALGLPREIVARNHAGYHYMAGETLERDA